MLGKLYESEEKRWIINSVGGQKGEIIQGTELCIGADLLLHHSKNGRIKPAEFVLVFTKVEEEDFIFNFVFCLFTQNSLQSDGTPPPACYSVATTTKGDMLH